MIPGGEESFHTLPIGSGRFRVGSRWLRVEAVLETFESGSEDSEWCTVPDLRITNKQNTETHIALPKGFISAANMMSLTPWFVALPACRAHSSQRHQRKNTLKHVYTNNPPTFDRTLTPSSDRHSRFISTVNMMSITPRECATPRVPPTILAAAQAQEH